MTQHKKAPSGGSVHAALKRAAQLSKAIEQVLGKAPKMHADHHEANMRNHLRMRTSAK
jgi:hypothetical protein